MTKAYSKIPDGGYKPGDCFFFVHGPVLSNVYPFRVLEVNPSGMATKTEMAPELKPAIVKAIVASPVELAFVEIP